MCVNSHVVLAWVSKITKVMNIGSKVVQNESEMKALRTHEIREKINKQTTFGFEKKTFTFELKPQKDCGCHLFHGI